MEGDASSGSAGPDEWGSAVASGDATKLAELVLVWSGSKPERALSVRRDCLSLLENEVAFSGPAFPALHPPPTSPGPTRTRCLDALIVALNDTGHGKSWYTSTKELQLASLEFCIACRNHQTVHMNVDERIPRRLLAAADAPPPHPKRLCRTRVPRLKARRVTWNMPTAAELRHPIFAMEDMDYLELGDSFEDSLEAVAWPRRLEILEFCRSSPFNNPVDLVELPVYLQRLRFGRGFNRPIEQVSWPASLQSLEFGARFNKPIEEDEWPPSLRHLAFFIDFNQPIERVTLPASLQQFTLAGAFNHPIEDIAWPSSLRKLKFSSSFKQTIQRAKFPASLQQLVFVGFNHPVEDAAWPSSLRQLEFGLCFNQPIQRAMFPASLQQLNLEGDFNQPIEDVLWPACLQRLVFGIDFNQPVDNVRWPALLQEVTFGWCDDSQDNRMVMYSQFNKGVGSSVWPESLRRLTLGGDFRQSLQGLGTWMPNLEAVRVIDWEYDPHNDTNVDSQNDSLLRGIEWPKGLRELTVWEKSNLEDVETPSTVEILRRYNNS